jgi:hypothetical protein
MRRIKLITALASMAMMLVASAAPAMALDNNPNWWDWNNHNNNGWWNNNPNWWDWNNHNNNGWWNNNGNGGLTQSNEQEVQSGDSSQTFTVTGGGDNSNACQGIQGVSNTGNAANNTGVLQTTPSNNDGNNWNRWNNGNNGEVEVGNGDFTISPSSTTTCDQQVNQAATAS